MAVVKNLAVRGYADFRGMYKEMQKASSNMQKFSHSIKGGMKIATAAFAGFSIGSYLKEAMQDAVKTEAAVGSLNNFMGDSADEFLNWAKKNAQSFGLSQSSAIQFGRNFANLISVFSGNSKQTVAMTQDLLKASSIVAATTGYDLQTVAEKITSGLRGETESIQDLGINAEISMLKTTEAFAKLSKGKAWEKLSFNTQAQIRYFAIMEQASKKFGNSIADNTAMKLQILNAQLSDIKLNLGQAFMPILNIVVPALSQLSNWLVFASSSFELFMTELFGKQKQDGTKKQTKQVKAQESAYKSLGNSIKKAGDKAKGALAGFDKINVLSSGSSSTDSTAATPKVSTNLGENKQTNNFGEKNSAIAGFANSVKKAFSSMMKNETFSLYFNLFEGAVLTLWKILKDFGKDMFKFFTSGYGKKFGSALTNMFKLLFPVIKFLVKMVVSDIKLLFRGISNIVKGVVRMFSGIFNGEWSEVWKGFGQVLKGAVQAGWVIIQYFFGTKIFGIIGKFFKGFGLFFKTGFTTFKTSIKTYFTNALKALFETRSLKFLINDIKAFFTLIKLNVAKYFDFGDLLKSFKNIGKSMFDAIASAFKNPSRFFKSFMNGIIKFANKGIQTIGKTLHIPSGVLKKFVIPEISTKLATGGIVSRATPAIIGEAGAEAVIPLERNTQGLDKIANLLASKMGGFTGDIVVNMDSSEFMRWSVGQQKRLSRQAGKPIGGYV